MSDEPAPGDGVPDPVQEWLAGVAEGRDVTERDLLVELLAEDGDGSDAGTGVEVAELLDRIDAVEDAVDDLDAELEAKIQDVRDRVVQVKRETDSRAPVEHDHGAYAEAIERLERNVGALGRDFVDVDAAVDDLQERLEAVDDRMADGFENFEEVLEYLVDATDRLDEKVETLARATLDVRERVGRLESANARREATDRLRRTAHEHGVTEADCGACGRTVHLGLLSVPECPHCAASFTEVEPRTGFFRSSVLQAGEQPALEGAVEEEPSDLTPLVEGEGPTPPAAARTDEDRPPSSNEGPGEDRNDGPGLDSVSGIGPAFAAQLREAGVETAADLAASNPERLADETDVAPGRMEVLVNRAGEQVERE